MEQPPVVKFNSIATHWDSLMPQYTHVRSNDYLPWSLFHRIIPLNMNAKRLWAVEQHIRQASAIRLNYSSEAGQQFHFNMTPKLQAFCHRFDMVCNAAAHKQFEMTCKNHGFDVEEFFLIEPAESARLSGASEDDCSIAYSVQEDDMGAMTPGERIVSNSLFLFQEAVTNSTRYPLSMGMLKKLNSLALDADKSKLREKEMDNLAGNTLVMPPRVARIPDRIEQLCHLINNDSAFVHPLVKAAILHFALLYEYAFEDGNGRVARAMFYWSLVRSGYPVADQLCISEHIKAHAKKMQEVFFTVVLHDFDLTYFLEFTVDALEHQLQSLEEVRNEVAETIADFHASIPEEVWKALSPACRQIALKLIGWKEEITPEYIATMMLKGEVGGSSKTVIKQLLDAGLFRRDDAKRIFFRSCDELKTE